jgi:hypothetical protein
MSTAYFIAGSVFLLLSMVWAIVQYIQKRNIKHEESTKDGQDAIKKHDVAGLFDAIRRRMLNR